MKPPSPTLRELLEAWDKVVEYYRPIELGDVLADLERNPEMKERFDELFAAIDAAAHARCSAAELEESARREHPARIRSAIAHYDLVCSYMVEHEAELWAAHRENRFHPGWSLFGQAVEGLDQLAEACMTDEQRAMVWVSEPEWQLASHVRTDGGFDA